MIPHKNTANLKARINKRLLIGLLLGGALLPNLQGCFPIVAAGVGTGVLATLDRRTFGAQTEDETIEWKASSRVSEKIGDKAHVNFTSYNRKVLLSGEAASPEIRAEIERIVSAVPNVAGVYNELAIAAASAFTARSNDAFITSKVKARFVDIHQFNANHVKVVSEAGTVFLLGLLTQREADSAVEITRTTAGVMKVVNLMEIISDAKAKELDLPPPDKSKQPDSRPAS
ncbi:BON domain-containing protein [Rhodocyclus tenuis]|uniref:Osmotically-inducible protein OsmY n=1 Tax=Rhodocyclus tenuis TaxID=1066 RepID=A0A840G380_RHOTE|nr:BON domain-containing protein [Rhodocyclus tenuis]MBB4248834.1 osmotically-inducible protein OsmY [Rhodocyclus tenuis]MBK1680790.1 transporter [Rhodocyclus tenuis]